MDIDKINSTSFNSQKGDGWLPVVNQPWRAIAVLFGAFFIMLIILSAVMMMVGGPDMSPKAMRIFTIVQDLLVFILPAILAAFIATRLPASLLTVNVKPRTASIFMAVLVMLTSLPAMEWIIELNNNIHLPESMSALEESLRNMENTASDSISDIAGGDSVGDLIIGILIIGVLTAIAEELFFRGALQNLFMSMSKVNKHFAIWAAAVIFSFMHFQFFGFIPRVLLGAYFGYLIWWTGSVWVPVIAHAFNNSLVVVLSWIAMRNGVAESMEEGATISIGNDAVTIAMSFVVTVMVIIILRRNALRHRAVTY